MKKWHIGVNFNSNDSYYILKYLKNHKYIWEEDNDIISIYGSFPNIIWNGGRVMVDFPFPKRLMKETIKRYNSLGLAINYTYTNCLVEEKHIYDHLGNYTLEIANNGKNGIICNKPVLENYIRKNYPNFKYYLSATNSSFINDKELENLKDKYDLLCLSPNDSRNKELMKRIGVDNCIVIVDEMCHLNCIEERKLHYIGLSTDQMNFEHSEVSECLYRKRLPENNNYPCTDTVLSKKEINDLEQLGVEHFKLVTRATNNIYLIKKLCECMIKEKYKKEFEYNIIKILNNNRAIQNT